MAQQNKPVTIAVIAMVALAVIGIGSYFLLAGSPAPAPVVTTPPPSEPPPVPPETKPRKASNRPGAEDGEVKAQTKKTENLPPEELAKKRGPTNKPRGIAP